MIGSLAVIVFFQVLNRLIFHISAAWTEELGRYIFVWVSMLGAASGIRKGVHLNVGILQNAAPKAVRRIMETVSDVICMIFFGVLLCEGGRWIFTAGSNVLAASMNIPMAYVQAIIPISGGLMLIFVASHLCGIFKHSDEDEREE